MLTRNDKGRLNLKSLDLQIFLGDLFAECKNKKEVEWLQEQLQDNVDLITEERIEEL